MDSCGLVNIVVVVCCVVWLFSAAFRKQIVWSCSTVERFCGCGSVADGVRFFME